MHKSKEVSVPTGKVNLQWFASRLTEKDLGALLEMFKHRASPQVERLQRKHDKLLADIKMVEAKIAKLSGEAPTKMPGSTSKVKPEHNPVAKACRSCGRPAKATASQDADAHRVSLLARLEKVRAAKAAKRAMV